MQAYIKQKMSEFCLLLYLCKTAKAKTGDDAARLKTEISEN
jgi:hypothetical protein